MANYLIEPRRRVPVRGRYDVLVIGGGIAGVASAIAAAREGASVCLIEKEFALGGLATLGNVIVYLPLCDGMGRLLSGGLAESFLKLSLRDGSHLSVPGGMDIPACWKTKATPSQRADHRYLAAFNPATFALALEQLVLKHGIDLLYDTRFCTVHKQKDRIDAVLLEDKGGRFALACRVVVDASGDADLCLAAGEKLDSCAVNVPCGWFYYLDENRRLELCPHSSWYDFRATSLPPGIPQGFGLRDSRDLTAMHLASNQSILGKLTDLRRQKNNPQLHLLRLPAITSYRTTRRLVGALELDEKDDRNYFPDTIGMVGHWRLSGPVYCIPFRCLPGVKSSNLITAGRCISTTRAGWDITRVIPACAVTGEAAGAASALLARNRVKSFSQLDIPLLQRMLHKRKVILNPRLTQSQETLLRADAPAAH